MNIRFESTFNTGYLAKAVGRETGWACSDGGYDQLRENVLNPHSELYGEKPDMIVLLPDGRMFDTMRALATPLDVERAALVETIDSDVVAFAGLVTRALQGLPEARVLVCLPPVPPTNSLGALDGNLEGHGINEPLERLNTAIADAVRGIGRAYVCSLDNLCRRHGWEILFDRRVGYLTKSPYSRQGLTLAARFVADHLRAVVAPPKKVVLCDLDNTLWGGIVGEDGPRGIRIAADGPAKSFHDFQMELKQASRRGILLAVVSKNNEADVLEVLNDHPDQVLKADDFAAMRINWRDKASNIREIAEELNLGLDTFVFLDDSPVEREWVRLALPEVQVIDLPEDPSDYGACLRDISSLWTATLTGEDRKRTQSYHLERQRRSRAESFGSYDAYLKSLDMVVGILDTDKRRLPRVVQLINRTNQFNLTSRRYNEAQVSAMLHQPERYQVLALSLKDMFDDYDVVGVSLLERTGDTVAVDVLLMSCRVLGRKVETAFLADMVRRAAEWGAVRIEGTYIPSGRNVQVAEYYANHGFALARDEDGGATVWTRDCTPVSAPEHIRLITSEAGGAAA